MFFSDDKELMLERLVNARAFLYKKVSARTKEHPNRIRWELAHRFTQFPIDIASCTQYPYMFSPSFQCYLDVDRKGKKFLIKDSFTQEVTVVIPKHVMDCESESHIEVASRFAWLDNNSFKIINREGVERKIDIVTKFVPATGTRSKVFEEVEFSVIPLFDKSLEMREGSNTHFYFEKSNATVKDTLVRLQTKYQSYKQAFELEGCRKLLENRNRINDLEETIRGRLYPQLFTVDYSLDKFRGRYVADLSFTFLHWNLMEKMETGQITTDKIDRN